jgi:hypothetical protein
MACQCGDSAAARVPGAAVSHRLDKTLSVQKARLDMLTLITFVVMTQIFLGHPFPRDAQRDTSKRAIKTSFENKESGEKRDT